MFAAYQSILPQQVLLGELISLQIPQIERPSNFRLPISFAHLDDALPFHPGLFVLEVENKAGGGCEEKAS